MNNIGNEIKVASVNCRGLGNPGKRRDVLHYLRQKHFSIYFLQDTHFDSKLEAYITAEWGYKAVYASYSTNSRGVAILFNDNFEFEVKKVGRDTEGNFLIVHIKTMDTDIALVNVYG